MTPKFEYGRAVFDARWLAEKVVARRPYLLPGAVDELAELMAADFNAFCTKAAPLRSRKHLFSAAGLADLPRAIKVIQGYISAEVAISYFNATEPLWSVDCAFVRFRASAKECCAEARLLDGIVVHREDRFPLTLPDCDADYCPCRWVREPNL